MVVTLPFLFTFQCLIGKGIATIEASEAAALVKKTKKTGVLVEQA